MTRGPSVLAALALAAALLTGSCKSTESDGAKRSEAILRAEGADGNWAAYGGGYRETHYSPLEDINQQNVGQLGLAWAIDLPTLISTHSTPIAVDGVVYYVTGLSVVSAADAVTGKVLWSHDPAVAAVAGEKQRGAWGARGLAWWDGKVYVGTMDGRLIALDAKTGAEVWSVQTTMGPNDGRYITGAPRVFNGKVIIGHGGADFAPVRGYVTTYDAETGKKLWRFFTVPGKPGTTDGEASDSIMAEAAKTWKGEWWKYGGGGTAWNAIAYDPDYNRIYIGTGNGAPWNRDIRSPGGGDNWFLCGIIAVEADTGKYLWHYQTAPGEQWDFNSAMDIELAKLTIAGKPRDVILHAPKNGFFYVIDRANGKLISAEPFARVTWASGIDKGTGRPIETPEARPPAGGQTLIWPGGTGAHNWMAMSFSPKTGLVYIPKLEAPGLYSNQGIDPKTWAYTRDVQLNSGYSPFALRAAPPPSAQPMAALLAWDPVAQKARWSIPFKGLYHGGAMSTGGGLVFQGNLEGRFVAYAADTGKALWSFEAQNGIIGQPISFRAKGKQYVTVMTGVGGVAGSTGSESRQFGWDYRSQRRHLLTFVLGGKEQLPPLPRAAPAAFVDDKAFKLDDAAVERGMTAFSTRCLPCHAVAAVGAGGAPDLRTSAAVLDPATFEQIVRGGVLAAQGMPKYGELSDADLADLRQYIVFRARATDNKSNGIL
jgi:quinohemoprotein ethanol dehydrogenase